MTGLVALVIAASPLTDAYRSLLVAREPLRDDASLQEQRMPQPYWPELELMFMSGWADGGHRKLETYTLALKDKAVHVVVPDLENIDDDGYAQRLKTLWLCPIAHVREVLGARDDIDQLMKRVAARKERCVSLSALVEQRFAKAFDQKQPREWLDAFAMFLGALVTGTPSLKPLKRPGDVAEPQLAALLQTGDAGNPAAWVAGRVEFAPWGSTSNGKGYAGLGMVEHGDAVDLIEVRCERQRLSVVRKSVAFVRRYIE